MEKAIIWGAGYRYEKWHSELCGMYDIVGIVDNNPSKQGLKINGAHVYKPDEITEIEFDRLLLITARGKTEQFLQAVNSIGISPNRILLLFSSTAGLMDGISKFQEFGVEISDQSEMIARGKDFKVLVKTPNCEGHLKEIFVEAAYKCELDERDTVYIDIGMNTGFASLYFAGIPYVSKVYSYELFPQVFEIAKRNLELNKNRATKIIPFNYGLFNKDAEIKARFVDEWIGGSSAVYDTSHIWSKGTDTIVVLKNAADVLAEIYDKHYNNQRIVIKIDCEGSEYKILDSMESAGLLKKTDVIFGEWHIGNVAETESGWANLDKLKKQLTRNGFACKFEIPHGFGSADRWYLGNFFAANNKGASNAL